MATWPSTLPQSPLISGYSEDQQSSVVRTNVDAGPALQRRRFTATTNTFSMSMLFTKGQYEDFMAFYDQILENGSKSFTWEHPITGVSGTYRFIGNKPPKISLKGLYIQVTMNLESMPTTASSYAETILVSSNSQYLMSTFTRNGTATYFDANGVLQTAAANVPRWETDPATGIAGLLIEGSRTNYALSSSDWNSVWGMPSNGSVGGVSVVSGGSPFHVQTTTAQSSNSAQNISGLSSQVYCVAAILEIISTSGTPMVWLYDPTTQTADFGVTVKSDGSFNNVQGNATNIQTGVQALGTGPNGGILVLMWASGTPVTPSDSHNLIVYPLSGGTATGESYVHACWIEDGAFPTSYIPTAGSAVTRAADDCVISDLSGFDLTQGTFVAEFDIPYGINPNYPRILGYANAANANATLLSLNGNNGALELWNGSAYFDTSNKISLGISQKAAMAYSPSGRVAVLNGGTAASDSNTVGAISKLYVGRGASSSTTLYGHIKSLKYYPYAMTATELQAVTA